MARRRRIPGILDILVVDDVNEIAKLLDDRQLDRVPPTGPLANRIIVRRIRNLLSIGAAPLPALSSRFDDARRQAQAENAERLNAAALMVGKIPARESAPIVDYIKGGSDRDAAGMALQAVTGRLFSPDWRPDEAAFNAAVMVNQSLASRNPFRWIIDRLTGRPRRARDGLAVRVGGNPYALHATMIAIHNLLVTVDRLRELYSRPAASSVGADEALARSLAAPETLMREALRPGDTIAGAVAGGTLVTVNLRKATDDRLLPASTLLDGHWSACPASGYVKALVKEIWRRVQAGEDVP